MIPAFPTAGDTTPGLALDRYRQPITLDEPFRFDSVSISINADAQMVIEALHERVKEIRDHG